MAFTVSNFLAEPDFKELIFVLIDNNYYEFLFPFLLGFALLYTVLQNVKIFQNKSGGINKPVIFVVSFIVSFFGTSFETSPGMSVGKLLMMMFPNISALTIGILCLYIVGAIMGKNFFTNMYRKDFATYFYYFIGAIALGAVVFYMGIAMGVWSFDYLDASAYWNVILGVGFLIFGIVMIFLGYFGVGFLFLVVLFAFVLNSGEGSILRYFLDPFVFVTVLVISLLAWIGGGSNRNEKEELRHNLISSEASKEEYKRLYGGKEPQPYRSRIYDAVDQGYENNKKKWKRKYGDEDW